MLTSEVTKAVTSILPEKAADACIHIHMKNKTKKRSVHCCNRVTAFSLS